MVEYVDMLFIRHGLTESNKLRQYIGWSNPSLSSEGIAMLKASDAVPDLVVGSDLNRTRETSAILFPDQPYTVFEDWRELSFGDWEERTYEQLKNDSAYRKWIDAPFEEQPPNGESFEAFSSRIWKAWDRTVDLMLQQKASLTAVVTHGGPLRFITSYFLEQSSFWDHSFSYGEGIRLRFKKDDIKERKPCISYSVVRSMGSENG
ncbi:histidine phosphatase family protein [Priestia flexa]|uniref:Histidine phosphatase family protein n=1 Tax=Priestia flexa TaxID=86664 RepID=A0ABU4J3J5_9BACI|nr:histidine phosphatase family protein [Priestia flexa]MDW8515565.1 histidine phosphatase family protein [Priestia flexa]